MSLAGSLALGALFRSSDDDPTVVDGAVELTYGRGVKCLFLVLGAAMLALTGVLVAGSIFGDPDPQLDRILPIVGPAFLLLGATAILESRVCLRIDERGIGGRSAWRGYRAMRWDSIERITYSSSTGCFKLRGRSGEVLRVGRLLRGHQTVVAAIEGGLTNGVGERAVQRYRNARVAGF